MSHRYYVETPVVGAQATLAGPEAHHLAHVMRAKVGEIVTLFDGAGAEHTARIARIDRATVQLEIVASAAVDRELPCPLVVGVSLPKGDRQRWLIEKLVELGVTRRALYALRALSAMRSSHALLTGGLKHLRAVSAMRSSHALKTGGLKHLRALCAMRSSRACLIGCPSGLHALCIRQQNAPGALGALRGRW